MHFPGILFPTVTLFFVVSWIAGKGGGGGAVTFASVP